MTALVSMLVLHSLALHTRPAHASPDRCREGMQVRASGRSGVSCRSFSSCTVSEDETGMHQPHVG